MRIICIDDEPLDLELTMRLCRELALKPETVGFTSAIEALAWLGENTADIALLDINMPDMDGLSLAARIKEIRTDITVIFITRHAEYAVEAFLLRPSGYILKPANAGRIAEEVEYALSIKPPEKPAARVSVRTFGEFDLLIDGKPISFPRSRSKELLAYLVDRQGSRVSRANIFAVLWEEGYYDRSMQKYLDVIIRSLRKVLEQHGAGDIIEMGRGTLRICPEKIDCDLYRFFTGDVDTINSYRGEYMTSYSWASMTEAYMERFGRGS